MSYHPIHLNFEFWPGTVKFAPDSSQHCSASERKFHLASHERERILSYAFREASILFGYKETNVKRADKFARIRFAWNMPIFKRQDLLHEHNNEYILVYRYNLHGQLVLLFIYNNLYEVIPTPIVNIYEVKKSFYRSAIFHISYNGRKVPFARNLSCFITLNGKRLSIF